MKSLFSLNSHRWLFIWLALMVVSGGAMLVLSGPVVVVSETVVASNPAAPLRVRWVKPSGTTTTLLPALVLVAPYCLPPNSMDVMATELARRGIVCAVPDFYGKTAAESRQHMGADCLDIMTKDVLAIVAALETMPDVDSRRIGVAGLSVGGTVAFMAGCQNDRIAAVIPIGIKTEMYPNMPRNLMLIAGLYDEFRTPTTLLDALATDGVATTPRINTLYGSLTDGTARTVAIVPTCDHFTAVSDPLLIREVARWCEGALGAPVSTAGTMREVWRTIASGVCVFAATILAIIGAAPVLLCIVQRLSAHMPAWLAIRLTCPVLLCGVAICWIVGVCTGPLRMFCTDVMIALPLAYCAACHIVGHRLHSGVPPPSRPFRIALFTVVSAWLAIMLSWGIMSMPCYFRWPWMVGWYPAFVALATALIPCKLLMLARSFLFTEYHTTLMPAWPWYALMISLVLVPDWCARMVHAAARGMETALDSGALSRIRVGASKPTLALLAAIIVALIIVLMRRTAEGMVNRQTMAMAGIIMLRSTILPFFITWCIMRSRLFAKLIGPSFKSQITNTCPALRRDQMSNLK